MPTSPVPVIGLLALFALMIVPEALAEPVGAAEGAEGGPDGDGEADEALDAEGADEDGPDAEASDEATEDLAGPERCPRAFGTAELKARHAVHRERMLIEVERANGIIDVAHSTDWRSPVYLRFKGIELEAADPEEGAVFSVGAPLRALGCPPGPVRLEVDDSLGDATAILAVFEDVVLVEFEGQLAYLATREAGIPQFRMIWIAPWRIIRRRATGVSQSTTPQAGRRPPVRRPPPRRPARRR